LPLLLQATLEDVVQHHPQEDLQHLLVAGLACAQEAISVLEVSPHAFDDPAAVAALQDGHETDGDTHLPPQHSNSAAFSDGRPSSSLDMHRYHMEHPSALRTNLCRIVYANPALEALMGRSSADLYDLSCLISPDTDLQDIQALQHALRDRRPATVKILCSRPSGAFWMTLSLSPIHHTFPFRSAAWVPGSMPPTPGGARSVAGDDFSRSCSSDLVPGGGQGRQQHQSYMRSNTPDMCNAVAEALEAVRGSQRQGGQPGEVTAHITCAASEAGGGPPGGPLHYLCVFQDMTEQIRQKVG
jgi:PAS domain-containing protein